MQSSNNNSTTSNMKVVVRIRPLSQRELDTGAKSCCERVSAQHVVIRRAGVKDAYLKSQSADLVNDFAFDNVFAVDASQDEVYRQTVQPYLQSLLAGQHVTVLAYGATGAGKTHTMFGSDIPQLNVVWAGRDLSSDDRLGVIPRCLGDLCELVAKARKDAQIGEAWSLSMGFFEIYNDHVFDLLTYSGKSLVVREDAERGVVQVVGLHETTVSSPSEIFEQLVKAQKLRKMEPTMANVVSSRSHAILQVTLRHITRSREGVETQVESKLSLVDLAGSERASSTNNRGVRLQEGANINKSLLALANCINALSEKALNSGAGSGTSSVVKYRDSKLTHILKTSLEGNCNLVMISNINPADSTFEDSLRTLQYANRAKNIKVSPTAREQVLESTSLEREARLREDNALLRMTVQILQEQNERLKMEKAAMEDELAIARESLPRRFTFGFRRSSQRRSSTAHELPRESVGASRPSSSSSSASPNKSSRSSLRAPASPELQETTAEREDEEHNQDSPVDEREEDNENELEEQQEEIDVNNLPVDSPRGSSLSARRRSGVEAAPKKAPRQRRGFWSMFGCGAIDDVDDHAQFPVS